MNVITIGSLSNKKISLSFQNVLKEFQKTLGEELSEKKEQSKFPLPTRRRIMRKVAVVDDDEKISRLVAILLKRWQYEVECFGNGKEVADRIEKSGIFFNILITDYNMPKMNGIELIRLVKKNKPEIRCILMSGNPDAELLALKERMDIRFFYKIFIPEDSMGRERLKEMIEGN